MDDATLVKLVMIPFKISENVQLAPPAGPPFVAQFNPETYAETTEIELAPTGEAHGATGNEAKFKSIKPKTYSFKFLIDGSNVSPAPGPFAALDDAAPGSGLSVVAQIEAFKATVGFSGNIHRPHYLLLVWGRLIATVAVETFTIDYKLFSPAGLPIRAEISATFKEHRDNALNALVRNLASPDIEHAHRAVEGENLPAIVHGVYGDPAYYIAVAVANDLDTVRHVAPGRPLYLPPLR